MHVFNDIRNELHTIHGSRFAYDLYSRETVKVKVKVLGFKS